MSEAMNLAAVESAQVFFICQDNGWATSKPSGEQALTSIATCARIRYPVLVHSGG